MGRGAVREERERGPAAQAAPVSAVERTAPAVLQELIAVGRAAEAVSAEAVSAEAVVVLAEAGVVSAVLLVVRAR